MHFFGLLGTLMFTIGFIALCIVAGTKFIALAAGTPRHLITNSPYFYVSLTSMLMGTQLFLAGFLGELISRSATTRNHYKIQTEI